MESKNSAIWSPLRVFVPRRLASRHQVGDAVVLRGLGQHAARGVELHGDGRRGGVRLQQHPQAVVEFDHLDRARLAQGLRRGRLLPFGQIGLAGGNQRADQAFGPQVLAGHPLDVLGCDLLDLVDVAGGEVRIAGGHQVAGHHRRQAVDLLEALDVLRGLLALGLVEFLLADGLAGQGSHRVEHGLADLDQVGGRAADLHVEHAAAPLGRPARPADCYREALAVDKVAG